MNRYFHKLIFEIETRTHNLDRQQQIRIRKWLEALSTPLTSKTFKRHRNNYAKFLLYQIVRYNRLEDPFDELPKFSYNIPNFLPCYRNIVGDWKPKFQSESAFEKTIGAPLQKLLPQNDVHGLVDDFQSVTSQNMYTFLNKRNQKKRKKGKASTLINMSFNNEEEALMATNTSSQSLTTYITPSVKDNTMDMDMETLRIENVYLRQQIQILKNEESPMVFSPMSVHKKSKRDDWELFSPSKIPFTPEPDTPEPQGESVLIDMLSPDR
ncbi:hypothetical protein PCE1_002366 [Barthelona sp. PCE]